MNLFLEYQKKITTFLKILEKKKLLKIPLNIKLAVESPPKNQKADISCNVAMILAKANRKSPRELAEIIKKNLYLNFEELKSIEIAGPGFLNITFANSFWNNYLIKVIKLDSKYGSNLIKKKNII